MSSLRAVLSMAWRESRASRRRLLLFGSAISIGVAALVAVGSFTMNLETAVRSEARQLLGADLVLGSRRPFTRPIETLLDSLEGSGLPVVRRMSFSAMAYLKRADPTRLVEVRAVGPGFPPYGTVRTSPSARWSTLDTGRVAIVDTSLLVTLGARIGDTLELGRKSFVIAASVAEVPGHLTGGVNALGSQVYIPLREVEGTGLIAFGSRVRYGAMLRFPNPRDAVRFDDRHRRLFERERVGSQTSVEAESEISDVLGDLSNFLQFVGLIALLLGGIGVASGTGAFVAGKLDTVAVLRCLGATRRLVFAIYLAQAAALGLVAAGLGAALGVTVQLALPRLLEGVLPVDVRVVPEPRTILAGIAVGLLVAVLFALRPLLEVRLVSPLQALRRPFESGQSAEPRDPWRLATLGALAVAVVALCVSRDEDPLVGMGFALAIGVAVVTLALTARGAAFLARRAVKSRRARESWPYVVRQGIANLHRPRNQTRSVIIALGFGVAMLAALYLVQTNLLRFVARSASAAEGRPNLVLLDVQPDQASGVVGEVRGAGLVPMQVVPIVPMRIASINGRPLQELLRDTSAHRAETWSLRHEYRSTWRDTINPSEQLVRGAWWSGRGEARDGRTFPVSLSTDIAEALRVGIGEEIAWDVQGTRIVTRVVALREVDWGRFETNFFAVFSSSALEGAPHFSVVLTRADNASRRARLQRSVAERYPNVTSLDVALVQGTVERVLAKASLAVRFMAAFALGTGALVLLGAVAAGRLERIREGALLKTLGATRRQLGRILLAEYATLGLLAAAVGTALATVFAWAFTDLVLELEFSVPPLPLVATLAGTAVLVALVGMTASREVFRRTAMEVLRDV